MLSSASIVAAHSRDSSLAVPVRVSKAAVVAAATCGGVAVFAAAFAAVYAWHRLRGPVPLVAWAASLCASPRAGSLGDMSTPLNVPEDGKVQVIHRCHSICPFAVRSRRSHSPRPPRMSLTATKYGSCCLCMCERCMENPKLHKPCHWNAAKVSDVHKQIACSVHDELEV